jgi:hypothetical protein
MVLDNGYYVDKTGYIRLMEEYKNLVFCAPAGLGNPYGIPPWSITTISMRVMI